MNSKITSLAILLASGIFISSCKKKEEPKPDEDLKTYAPGVFITNEGPFQSGSGTVSFFDRNTSTVDQSIYESVNGVPLGNIVQSMTIHNGKAYIVINNAGKLRIADGKTFKASGTVDGLNQPRYFIGVDNTKGYLSTWGDGVKVIDLASSSVTSTIAVGAGPEHMVKTMDKVYVVNSGGFGKDSTITVIDTKSDVVKTVIKVSHNPGSIQIDKNGKIWVLCHGIQDWQDPTNDTGGALLSIDPATDKVVGEFTFPNKSDHPSDLIINDAGDKLYYTNGAGVYEFAITSGSLNNSPVIAKGFYEIGFDPVSGYIYGSDPRDYASDGWVYRYQISGTVVDSFKVGVIPGGFYFN